MMVADRSEHVLFRRNIWPISVISVVVIMAVV